MSYTVTSAPLRTPPYGGFLGTLAASMVLFLSALGATWISFKAGVLILVVGEPLSPAAPERVRDEGTSESEDKSNRHCDQAHLEKRPEANIKLFLTYSQQPEDCRE